MKEYARTGISAFAFPVLLTTAGVRIPDRWRGEDHEYVKLDGSDGDCCILRAARELFYHLVVHYFPGIYQAGYELPIPDLIRKNIQWMKSQG